MTSQSIAALTRAHLSGRAPARRPITLRHEPGHDDDTDRPVEHTIGLDPAYYERGIQARRRAQERMADVTSILDDM